MFWTHYSHKHGLWVWGIVLFSRLSLLIQWPPKLRFRSLGSMYWSLHLDVGPFFVGRAHWVKVEEE